jgi:hypothetical protein
MVYARMVVASRAEGGCENGEYRYYQEATERCMSSVEVVEKDGK